MAQYYRVLVQWKSVLAIQYIKDRLRISVARLLIRYSYGNSNLADFAYESLSVSHSRRDRNPVELKELF